MPINEQEARFLRLLMGDDSGIILPPTFSEVAAYMEEKWPKLFDDFLTEMAEVYYWGDNVGTPFLMTRVLDKQLDRHNLCEFLCQPEQVKEWSKGKMYITKPECPTCHGDGCSWCELADVISPAYTYALEVGMIKGGER